MNLWIFSSLIQHRKLFEIGLASMMQVSIFKVYRAKKHLLNQGCEKTQLYVSEFSFCLLCYENANFVVM